MKTSETVTEIFKALAKFQSEVESPKKNNANPAFKREGKSMKYADLDAVIKAVTPALTNNGLSQIQFTSSNVEEQSVSIITLLTHDSGEFIQSDPLIVPAENFGKFNAQTIGSAITYGRRYALSAILGIASEDDDDANTQSLPNEKNVQPMNKKPENKQYRKQHEQQATPEQSMSDINQQLVEASERIKELGGDIEIVKKQFLESRGMNSFKEAYKKKELYEFMNEVAADMKEHAEQGELLKSGTTTAKVNWGQ